MHNYDSLKKDYGTRVSQTIDSPIMIFDFWELSDAFSSLLVVLTFGIVLYSWGLMFLLLIVTLGVVPAVKRRHNRGIFLHWPYRHIRISLPGILNPRGRRKFSD